jgi:hypothetical protein
MASVDFENRDQLTPVWNSIVAAYNAEFTTDPGIGTFMGTTANIMTLALNEYGRTACVVAAARVIRAQLVADAS